MTLRDILHVSGKPGLYLLKASSKNNVIAESLLDGRKTSISSRQPVMSLGDVAIYTQTEEMPLADVFKRFYTREGGPQALSHKSNKSEVEAFFDDMLPERDLERVYFSDMKKVLQWYNLLMEKGIINDEFFATIEKEREEMEARIKEAEEAAEKEA
ncbi:MAG: DUF5606 domain-containing protein [Cryomorphaceae bacterium]|nr:DUF5606 domain-containing protein [Cryomorphaceae bacterium]